MIKCPGGGLFSRWTVSASGARMKPARSGWPTNQKNLNSENVNDAVVVAGVTDCADEVRQLVLRNGNDADARRRRDVSMRAKPAATPLQVPSMLATAMVQPGGRHPPRVHVPVLMGRLAALSADDASSKSLQHRRLLGKYQLALRVGDEQHPRACGRPFLYCTTGSDAQFSTPRRCCRAAREGHVVGRYVRVVRRIVRASERRSPRLSTDRRNHH